jgi:hypothetical protein
MKAYGVVEVYLHAVLTLKLFSSTDQGYFFLFFIFVCWTKGPQIFQKSRSRLNTVGARKDDMKRVPY